MGKYEQFSSQLDKSTNISYTVQLAVMIRMVFSDFSIKGELLKVYTMQEGTKCEDINKIFKNYVTELICLAHYQQCLGDQQ